MARPPKTAPEDAPTVLDHPPARPVRSARLLPEIAVPPHAARILGGQPDAHGGPDPDTSPRVGGYALVARFPSSASADVFLGYKTTNFGFLRRAVVKWVDARRPDHALARQSLADEARALSCLDHPNVVSIFEYTEDEDGVHLAVEYVAGTDLRRCLAAFARRGAVLPWPHACLIVAEVLRALSHVHAARDPYGVALGIVHRDVNPSNVLLGEDGRVKLTDFGTVKMSGRMQEMTAPGMVKGKVRYLAPEYIQEQRCTAQLDVYGAGVMLFELLTGRPCFTGRTNVEIMMRIVREGIDPSALEGSGLPPALAIVVRSATAKDPRDRFRDTEEMLGALEAVVEGAGRFSSPSRMSEALRRLGSFSTETNES